MPAPVLEPSPVKRRPPFKWMRSPCYKQSQTTSRRRVKSFIVLASLLSFFSPLFSARANITNDVNDIRVLQSQIKDALDYLSADVHRDLTDVYNNINTGNGILGNISSTILTRDTFNYRMNDVVNALCYGQTFTADNNVLALLRRIADAQGGGSDMAPWWATNSSFILAGANYTRAAPDDGINDNAVYSFPQFMSLWSTRLSVNDAAPTRAQMQSGWFSKFGFNDLSASASVAKRNQRSYTWFDWMTDAARSNFVLRAGEFETTTNALQEWADETGAAYDANETYETNMTSLARSGTNSVDEILDVVDTYDNTLDNFSEGLFDKPQFDFEAMFPNLTGGDPNLVIFPAHEVGGVTIAEVRGSIELPSWVEAVIRGVCDTLYGIMFCVSLLGLIRSEYTFWTSLGQVSEAA